MAISRRHLLFGIAANAWCQETPTFSSDTKVVSLLATVLDKDGRVVKDLSQDDFTLLEDNKPQTIRYFSRESDLPLTVGILVDTSKSQSEVLEKERSASYEFLDQVLREGKDLAFVAHFDERFEVLQGLTDSRKALDTALRRLRVPERAATLLYSAVRDSSENTMKKRTGRKAIILLTDGVAFRDSTSEESAIEFAQRADTIVYSIRFSDRTPAYRPIRAAVMAAASGHGKQVLQRMAKETGGSAYEVSKNETIERIFSEIEEALRNQYSIGYTPEPFRADGNYRKIKLTTKDRSLVVHTRDGYYAQ
jgi:VWFA-related protein